MKSTPTDLALFLAQCVVDQPSQVRVSGRGHRLFITVHPGEEGLLIGRQGRTIQAIRTIMRAAGNPHLKIDLDTKNEQPK